VSKKGFYADKPLQLADRVERLGYYLNEEAAALIRKQHAEIEALRADAERYRWLRTGGIDHLLHGRFEELDAAIDAARSKT
jgi:cell division septum initiation protein DivIVA